jgi:hypothetical protein
MMVRARAYVYAGDWVADCPREGCGNVEHLYDRTSARNPRAPRIVQKPEFGCSNCGHAAPIEWPADMAAITAVLGLRPVPQNRNWYPASHEVAIRFRLPHGQSVADLVEENAAHGVSAAYKEMI